MKICVITAATWSIPKFRIDMIDEFVRRGYEVVVFGDEPRGKWDGFFEEHCVSYRTYPVSRNGMDPIADLGTLKSLIGLLRKERPDKIFTYQIKPNIYGGLAAHLSDVADLYMMMGGIGSIFLSEGVKRILRGIVSAEYRFAMRYAKRVFFQNRDDAEVFVDSGILDRKKIVLINGSGVNTDEFAQCPLPEAISFIFVGRAIKDKGAKEYLLASRELKRRYPGATCHFVGDVDSNPSSLNMDNIRSFVADGSIVWHGWQDDVRPFIAMASVFVLPSYREGTPKAALEAMSMGRAVITTDAPGCREVVVRNENGLLVKPGDAKGLAEAMLKLAGEAELVKKMGNKSRELVESKFDVRIVNSTICKTMGIN